jgi:hypothetical protein
LAEAGDPEYWIEREVIDPPPGRPDLIMPDTMVAPKSFVEDNVRRMEEKQAETPPGPAASLCMTMERGFPIFYLYDPDTRTITLAEHSGEPSRIGGKLWQDTLSRNQNADDLAVTLWLRSRGKSSDDLFDGPIDYSPALRLPHGA